MSLIIIIIKRRRQRKVSGGAYPNTGLGPASKAQRTQKRGRRARANLLRGNEGVIPGQFTPKKKSKLAPDHLGI